MCGFDVLRNRLAVHGQRGPLKNEVAGSLDTEVDSKIQMTIGVREVFQTNEKHGLGLPQTVHMARGNQLFNIEGGK